MTKRMTLCVMLLLAAATPVAAADMDAGLPQPSRFDLSTPDVEPLPMSRWDPPHADYDSWTPSRFDWSRPIIDVHPPADLPLSRPDVER
jgi:hypothetical protein